MWSVPYYLHQTQGGKTKYISTTKYEHTAKDFAPYGDGGSPEGYVHVIDRDKVTTKQHDLNTVIGNEEHWEEYEVAIEEKIDSCAIVGCYKVDGDGVPVGDMIKNPEYAE